jgi:hypothetical protein
MTHVIASLAVPGLTADPPKKVDIGIVTIRNDEFRAVLAKFPTSSAPSMAPAARIPCVMPMPVEARATGSPCSV